MQPFFGLEVPFLALLGVQSQLWEKGHTTLMLEPRPELTNHFGDVHGGVVTTLLDIAMSSAARSLYPDAAGVVTMDMSLQFMRSARGTLHAEGRVVQGGKSTAFCEAELRDAAGERIAKAIGTFKVRVAQR
jgi:uncharacterized protein (TIGR00369 family)